MRYASIPAPYAFGLAITGRAGYEWREHNGKYVLVAIATGLIASVLLNQR